MWCKIRPFILRVSEILSAKFSARDHHRGALRSDSGANMWSPTDLDTRFR
jgi:hypothetical protein